MSRDAFLSTKRTQQGTLVSGSLGLTDRAYFRFSGYQRSMFVTNNSDGVLKVLVHGDFGSFEPDVNVYDEIIPVGGMVDVCHDGARQTDRIAIFTEASNGAETNIAVVGLGVSG